MQVMGNLIILAIVVTGLALGRAFLIPIVIAVLATTLIAATADRFQRWGLPRALALLVSLLTFLAGFGWVLYVLSGQADAFTAAWPRYVARFETLAGNVSQWLGPDLSERFMAGLKSLQIGKALPSLVGSAGGLLTSLILVALYVGFMLAERHTAHLKLEYLFSKDESASHAHQTLAGIAQGVRDYIWIKTLMSLLTASVSYAVLKYLGVDFSETWALIIFFLNFIPSIGSVLGVIFPAVLALVQFDTIWQFLVIAVLLSTAQLMIGNVIEPAVMGRTLNLSPLVVMISLAFWGSIWGLVGAFLSVPLTAAIVIACSKIPSWQWLAVLLSTDGRIGLDRGDAEAGQPPS